MTCRASQPGHVTSTTPRSYARLEKSFTALVSHRAHVNTMCSRASAAVAAFGTAGADGTDGGVERLSQRKRGGAWTMGCVCGRACDTVAVRARCAVRDSRRAVRAICMAAARCGASSCAGVRGSEAGRLGILLW